MRILNYLDDWLILAQSQNQLCEHRDWCSRTSASWAFGSTGKRANSCRCRGSLFSVWSLDSVNQTARLTQERAQSVLNCLKTFKNRTAAPLKQVSETPGAYGGCSGGHTAGAAPYETASTLAPWPSPEVGVAEQHTAGPSHSSLPPNLHPVVRPFIPSGRSAPKKRDRSPGTLWFTRMPPPRAGGSRSTGLQCRGFGRVPNCTGISTA